MKFFSATIAIAGIVSMAVGLVPPPSGGTALQQILFDASYLFAWELIGASTDKIDLQNFCFQQMVQLGYLDRWAAVGLDANDIHGTVCLESGSFVFDTTSQVLQNIQPLNTRIFATQLINAFNSSVLTEVGLNPLTRLCNSGLSLDGLGQFDIDGATISAAVCNAAGAFNDGFSASGSINKTAVAHFYSTASALYAYELGVAANSTAELNTLCKAAPAHEARLGAMGLDAQCITDTICGIQQPLDIGVAVGSIIHYSTELFITILGNSANQYFWDYKSFLCKSLSFEGLNSVGLDSTAVLAAFC